MGDTANCDGLAFNGCEAHLLKDQANCGACHHGCMPGKHCKEGVCD